MKKIIVVVLLSLICWPLFSQDRHRVGDQPYDIFVSFRPTYYSLQDNFKDNYKWGLGGKVNIEWLYQELHLAWGISVGYNRYQPKSLKWDFVPTKQLFVAQEIPITLNLNYYPFVNKVKPYIGVGLSAMWGKYDYSFSEMENNYTDGLNTNLERYYYQEFEMESGFKFGIIPHVGLMFSLDHKNGFGFEVGLERYFANGRLEKQNTLSGTIYYTYIID
jgi:hypothetical protein